MGIDVYMLWPGQTEEETAAQCSGFSVLAGGAGYLREAYHGGPYVTRYLLPEAFDFSEPADGRSEDDPLYGATPIPGVTLLQRLPVTVALAAIREATVYGGDAQPGVVELSSPVEAATPLKTLMGGVFADIQRNADGGAALQVEGHDLGALHSNGAEMLTRPDTLPEAIQSFVAFVLLAIRKEMETGDPVHIYASW